MTGLEQQLTQSWPMESILKYMKKGIVENQRQVKDALEKKDKYFLEDKSYGKIYMERNINFHIWKL